MERIFRKELIADAALKLFSYNSYEDVTVDDIAKDAEFAKGTLYQYFESKDDIFVYVICRSIGVICEKIMEECLIELDFRKSLDKLISLYYIYLQQHKNLYISFIRLQLNGGLSQDLISRVTNSHQIKTGLMLQVINRGIKERVLVDVDPRTLLMSVESIIRGFNLPFANDKEILDTQEIIGFIKEVLFRGIMVKEE